MARNGYGGGRLPDGTPLNVAVYRAYRNNGLSHNQALAITAEVGRENGFNPSILFGSHTDPAANASGGAIRNVGMLSWNGGRGTNLEGYLRSRGVLGLRTQDNLNAQAAFSVREMQSRGYRDKLTGFWANPNASPESFARELGKNYVVWAYGQDSIRARGGGRTAFNWRAHDDRRRGHLNTLSQMLGGATYSAENTPDTFQTPQLKKNFDEFAAQFAQSQPAFRPPTAQKNFDEFAKQSTGFEPPQIQQGFDDFAAQSFTPPTTQSNFDEFAKRFK